MSTTRNPQAFAASASLHVIVLGVILWFAWANSRPDKESTPIFELVAGEGDNFGATEAPALGVAGGIKFDMPAQPASRPSPVVEAAPPEPSPVVAEVSPVQPAPVKVEPKPTAKPAPAEYKSVNMARTVERIADKRAANIEKKLKAEQKAADARAAKEAALNARRMTKEDFDRLNKNKSTSPSQKAGSSGAVSVKRIDAEGIAGGVAGGSTANKSGGAGGKALTREDIELSDAYISMLIQRLKQAHQKPDGLSDLLEATVKFRLTSSGSVVNVTIISSSRNAEFDQSVLAAFRRISLPPPPANLKTSDYTITFKMREDS
jgi:colicin import membrane protein